MKLPDIKIGILPIITSFGASLCCVLPMVIIFLGLGNGAFMLTTMKYRPLLYPLGIIGIAISSYLYIHKKRSCDLKSCKMNGGKLNLFLIGVSTALMIVITYVDFFLTSA
jgi:hypothetical protein